MVREKNFRFEVGYDNGVTIRVTHLPTVRTREDRPKNDEDITAVKRRLVYELLSGFFNVDDFMFNSGRCSVDGKFGDFYAAVHVPTNRTKSINSIDSQHVKNPHEMLLDLLVEELWRDGVLKIVETDSSRD